MIENNDSHVVIEIDEAGVFVNKKISKTEGRLMKTQEVKNEIYNAFCENYKNEPSTENAKKLVEFVDKDYGADVISDRENKRTVFPAYGAMLGLISGLIIFMNELAIDHTGKLWSFYSLALAVVVAVIFIFIARSDGKIDAIYFKAKAHLADLTSEEESLKLREQYLGVAK